MAATLTAAEERKAHLKDSNDWPYRFDIVPVKYMLVDIYQRPLTNFAETIGENFDPALVGTVCLSQRSKTKMALIDGQTRCEGARIAGVDELPSIVYEGLTLAQEADLFAKFQTQRRGMHSVTRFMSQVIAGYEEQVEINDIVTRMGFRIDQNPGTDRKGIRTPAALEWVYRGATVGYHKKVPSPELVERVLEVLGEAWPKSPPEARSAVMIKGLGYFLKQRDDVDVGKLIDRLSMVQPSELAKRASSLMEGRGAQSSSPRYMAEAIESQYMRGPRR